MVSLLHSPGAQRLPVFFRVIQKQLQAVLTLREAFLDLAGDDAFADRRKLGGLAAPETGFDTGLVEGTGHRKHSFVERARLHVAFQDNPRAAARRKLHRRTAGGPVQGRQAVASLQSFKTREPMPALRVKRVAELVGPPSKRRNAMSAVLVGVAFAAWAGAGVHAEAQANGASLTVVIQASPDTKYEAVAKAVQAVGQVKAVGVKLEVIEASGPGLSAVIRAGAETR
jgi:hypothetical protein